MKYEKPHLSFEQQLDHLVSRGMICADRDAAISTLANLGYYRLSAYAYPFRKLLPENSPRESSVQFRGNSFLPSADFSVIRSLSEMDRDLRLHCLLGLQSVELALRVRVAYVLGAHDAFGHLNIDSLDAAASSRVPMGSAETIHSAWKRKYKQTVVDAKSEDFVTHYVEKYGGRLPIWVATELMDLGSLVRLFGMMQRTDQNAVARAWGVTDGRLFYKWLKVLNYVRNVCAHHGRLWNRTLTYASPSWPEHLIPELENIAALPQPSRRKIYPVLAMIGHLTTAIESTSGWADRLRLVIDQFPPNETVSIQSDMGFPESWPLGDSAPTIRSFP